MATSFPGHWATAHAVTSTEVGRNVSRAPNGTALSGVWQSDNERTETERAQEFTGRRISSFPRVDDRKVRACSKDVLKNRLSTEAVLVYKGGTATTEAILSLTDIRIDTDKAERTLALMLREEAKMLPADANTLAAKMVGRLTHARQAATRPRLRDARIIPQYPTDEIREKVGTAVRALRSDTTDFFLGSDAWATVWEYGMPVPDDVVV
jgi:hypothetical protein